MTAQQDQRQRSGVFAAVDCELPGRTLDEVGGALDIRGRILHAGDPGYLGETDGRVVGKIRHGAPGHVVQDHGNVHAFGYLAEVPVQAFLGRLVVIGHD